MTCLRIIPFALVAAAPVAAQQIDDCGEVPPVTDLVEPWEETSATLGAGAIRVALLHGESEEGVRLLVLTLPPTDGADADTPQELTVPPARPCLVVSEGGFGFADLDIAGIETEEDAEAATLTARIPALRFVPESSELEEMTLTLTFGVADDTLTSGLEGGSAEPEDGATMPEDEAPEEAPAAGEDEGTAP